MRDSTPPRRSRDAKPPGPSGAGEPRRVLGLVFLTVFIDLVGFSILFPLFPAMLEHYVELEGEGSLVGRLKASLARIALGRSNADFAVVALFGGLLGSIYSLLQFLFAPVWGSLSDRIGRRRTLLVTLGGTALAYLVWFFSGRFLVLVAARLLGGVMAGNISIASAVVADTHAGPERAKGMGIVGMAIGLGFVLGPALGGIASLWDPTATFEGWTRFGVNPFSGAALVAFALALFNWGWALARFPETLAPEARALERRGRAARPEARTLRPFHRMRSLPYPGVRRANLVTFCYLAAFSAMEFTLTFLAVERFTYSPRDNMWMFVFVGLVIAFVQGGVVRRLVPRVGEKRVAVAGLACLIPGFLLVGWAGAGGVLYAGLFFMAAGSALAMPCLSALVSRYSPAEVQGLVLGTFRSVGALARAVGPIAGGLLYWLYGSQAPYTLGAAFLLLPLVLSLALPPVPGSAAPSRGPFPSREPGPRAASERPDPADTARP